MVALTHRLERLASQQCPFETSFFFRTLQLRNGRAVSEAWRRLCEVHKCADVSLPRPGQPYRITTTIGSGSLILHVSRRVFLHQPHARDHWGITKLGFMVHIMGACGAQPRASSSSSVNEAPSSINGKLNKFVVNDSWLSRVALPDLRAMSRR